jgi:hypothetical protein
MAHVGSGATFDFAQGGDDFAYTVSRKAMEEMMGVSLSNDLAWFRVQKVMERYFDGTTVLSTDFQTDMKQLAEDILKDRRTDPVRVLAVSASCGRGGGGDDFAYTISRKDAEEMMGMSLSDDQVWFRVQKVMERYCDGTVEGTRFQTDMKQFTVLILEIGKGA